MIANRLQGLYLGRIGAGIINADEICLGTERVNHLVISFAYANDALRCRSILGIPFKSATPCGEAQQENYEGKLSACHISSTSIQTDETSTMATSLRAGFEEQTGRINLAP